GRGAPGDRRLLRRGRALRRRAGEGTPGRGRPAWLWSFSRSCSSRAGFLRQVLVELALCRLGGGCGAACLGRTQLREQAPSRAALPAPADRRNAIGEHALALLVLLLQETSRDPIAQLAGQRLQHRAAVLLRLRDQLLGGSPPGRMLERPQ